jgi:NAD(P)-dependent dehydrogenase (short-subunit alcohol dehydrogenase family)
LSVITSHVQSVTGQEVICPEKATVAGPCRVIPQEFPDVACRNIDVMVPCLDDWQGKEMVRNLLGELTAKIDDGVVALRDRRRWVQAVTPLRLPPLEGENPALLRQDGVYLVTGGLGGIGLAIAEYLARAAQAKLVLIGRSKLPPREQWDQVISEEEESNVARKIRGVKQLEALGAEVLALAADVADEERMSAVVEQAVAQFGALHGVFHAAGVPGMGLIQLKTVDAAASVLAPKVMGTLVLERVLREREIEPDFIVLFSSETAFTGGGIGQVDYCAANAFLDGYARHHVGDGRLVTSINWGEWQWNAWEEGLEGFSAEVQEYFRTNRQKYGIAFEEGMEALARILSHRLPWVAVSTRDFCPIVEESGKQSAMALILAAAEQSRVERPKYSRPALGVSYAAPRNDLEREIAAVWGDLLGIDQVGINDNFFDLGGNSLVGLNLTARLRKELDVQDVPAHVLYEAPTVSALARFVGQDQQQDAEMVAEKQARGERYRASLQRRRQRQVGE